MKKTASLIAAATTVAAGVISLPAAHAAASMTPECRSSDVWASFGGANAGMSHVFGNVRLTNVSGHACWVQGYGGLSFVRSGAGGQVGRPAARTASPTPRVVLRPGRRAVSAIEMTTTGPYSRKVCRPERIAGLRVYAPDTTKSHFIRLRRTVCSNPKLQTLWHKAFHRA